MRRLILVFLVLATASFAQQPPSTAPKVRAITAFVRIERQNYRRQIGEALQFLRSAKSAYETAGLEVETIRVTTQPFPEIIAGIPESDAVALFRELDQFAARENFLLNIGPA